jgi:hypothetical protein
MAHVEKRVRNGRVTYRARYRDPLDESIARCSPARSTLNGS